jgi:1-pyrroline-5-carboxylate dehydrogenase
MVGAQPFGGFNMSGTDSKAGGPDYLPLFVEAKVIVERF